MSSSQTTTASKSLGPQDLVVIAFATCIGFGIAFLMVHVLLHRAWRPYAARMPQLVILAGMAAILCTIGSVLRYELWDSAVSWRQTICGGKVALLWLSAGALLSSGHVRVYRYHKVLVQHSTIMWPIWAQMAMLMIPFAVPPAWILARPSIIAYDEVTEECEQDLFPVERVAAAYTLFFAVGTVLLTLQLRVAQDQAPEEYYAAVTTSATLVFGSIAFPSIHEVLDEDHANRRRFMLVTTAAVSAGIFFPPLLRPLAGFITDDERYEQSGDYGFDRVEQQMKVKEMLGKFVEMNALANIPGRHTVLSSASMIHFYRDTLARELVHDYFVLQASTMRILADYVRNDAPVFLPFSKECRRSTLRARAASPFIFGRARDEVLEMLRDPEKSPVMLYSAVDSDLQNSDCLSISDSVDRILSWSAGNGYDASVDICSSSHGQDFQYIIDEEKSCTPVATPSPSGQATPLSPMSRHDGLVLSSFENCGLNSPPTLSADLLRSDGIRAMPSAATDRLDSSTEGCPPVSPSTLRDESESSEEEDERRRDPRRASAGEGSVKVMASIPDVHIAFGLQPDGSASSDDEGGRAVSGSSGESVGSIESKEGSYRSTDLADAAKAIVNPLFAATARAVGRQPKRNVLRASRKHALAEQESPHSPVWQDSHKSTPPASSRAAGPMSQRREEGATHFGSNTRMVSLGNIFRSVGGEDESDFSHIV